MKPIKTILPEAKSCVVSRKEWLTYVGTAFIAALFAAGVIVWLIEVL